MCETVWVLQSCYRRSRTEIAGALRSLLAARNVAFASSDHLARALAAFASGQGDFADYLIREHARAAGCSAVATFDGVLLKEQGFSAP
jgi:predicted nucleic-acid-binding protein